MIRSIVLRNSARLASGFNSRIPMSIQVSLFSGSRNHAPRFQTNVLINSRNKTAQNYHQRIQACHSDWKSALQILLEMCAEIKAVPVSTYNMVMECCRHAQEFERVRDVFQMMETHSVPPDMASFKNLLYSYRKSNDWQLGCQLLSDMHDVSKYNIPPDVHCYGMAIRACQTAGEYDVIFDLYDKMIENNIKSNSQVCSLLLHACFATSRWEKLVEIHDALVITTRNGRDEPEKTTGKGMDKLLEPDLKVEANSKTYHFISNAYAQLGNWRRSLDYINEMIENNIVPNKFAFNSLLYACAAKAEHKQSLAIIEKMKQVGAERDANHYCALMIAYSNAQLYDKAVEVISLMGADGVSPNVKVYDIAISSSSRAEKWVNALEFFDNILSSNLKPTQLSFNCAISACSRSGEWKKAVNFMFMMEGYGLRPSQETFGACIYACAKAQEFVTMFKILETMEKRNIKPNLTCLNSVLHGFEKIGYARDAIDFLATMRSMNVKPDVISYTSAIGACDRGDQWRSALELLDEMIEEGIEPNVITYNAAMSACKTRGKFEEAFMVFEKMQERGVRPNAHIYATMLAACNAKRYIEPAMVLMSRMKKAGIKMDLVAYKAAFHVMKRDKNIDGMIKTFKTMRAEGIEPDDSICAFILVTFDLLHRDEEALEFMSLTRELGRFKFLWNQPNVMDLSGCMKSVGRSAIRLLLADFVNGDKEPCDFKLFTGNDKAIRYKNMIPPTLFPTHLPDDNPRQPKGLMLHKVAIERWAKSQAERQSGSLSAFSENNMMDENIGEMVS